MSPKTTPMAPMTAGPRACWAFILKARILGPQRGKFRFFGYPRAYARGITRNFAHRVIGDRFRACIVVRISGRNRRTRHAPRYVRDLASSMLSSAETEALWLSLSVAPRSVAINLPFAVLVAWLLPRTR